MLMGFLVGFAKHLIRHSPAIGKIVAGVVLGLRRSVRGVAMTYPSTGEGKRARPRRSPFQLLMPIALGLAVGSALYYGYSYWSQHKSQDQALAAAAGDPTLAKPSPEECQVARAALAAIHAAGADKAWLKGVGQDDISLAADSKVINPADVAGYTDDEADNLRGKAAADWRWCAGLGSFVTGLGWKPMGGDDPIAVVTLGRPGLSKTGDEARAYEAFMAPNPNTGVLRLTQGPWLVTLHKVPTGVWQVTSTDHLKRAY
jgi:hypothetical protein